MFKKINYEDAVNNRIFSDYVSPRIVVVIPAYNEENSIGSALKSLEKQKIPEGFLMDVFIANDNSSDDTESRIKEHADKLDIFFLDTVNNKDRKSGALNQIYQLFFGNQQAGKKISKQQAKTVQNIKAFLGMDADVILAKDALITLWRELQSEYKIGAVSSNYTALLPESARKIPSNFPEREELIENGKFGGPMARFYTVLQNRSFAADTLEQKNDNYNARILGGQSSLFRFEALKDVYEHYKLNGVYSNESPTEDLVLTTHLRELGWSVKISHSSRAYVDTMTTLKSYVNQFTKWSAGSLQEAVEKGISTSFSRKLWLDELTLWLNGLIRIMLLVLIPISLALNIFQYNWIWIIPILVGLILNLVITYKTPNTRFIDYLLSFFMIMGEFEIWFDLYVDIKAWKELSRVQKDDLWEKQYAAEAGSLKTHSYGWITILIILILVIAGLRTNLITIDSALKSIQPYINEAFNILSYLALATTIMMLRKLFKIRGGFKA
ncbi:glycosyltransferase [Oenococcus alcoholitolerans]|uniref:glycosyltransferase n=1 Tax=Oenococcus alcoholitolerans TaxID=931074 RepID=UPI003F700C3A